MSKTILTLCGFVALGHAAAAFASHSVECRSDNFKYNECYVGRLDAPTMLRQTSHSACTWDKTWGYNAQTGYVWVGSGCAGVFGDAGRHHDGGYYHSAGNRAPIDPRPQYDRNGEPNFDAHGNYQGCHGLGCEVDAPAQEPVDTRPQFDKNGNPNFDTHGNYQGCHGLGCEVDTPAQEPVDTRPQFDKNGNPNFDTHGNYQGCHGDGCNVDTPPDNDDGGDH